MDVVGRAPACSVISGAASFPARRCRSGHAPPAQSHHRCRALVPTELGSAAPFGHGEGVCYHRHMSLLPANAGVATFGIWHCHRWRGGFASLGVRRCYPGGPRCCCLRWTELLQPWAAFSDEVSVMFVYVGIFFATILMRFCSNYSSEVSGEVSLLSQTIFYFLLQ
jgi:hypothetical protein